MEKSIDIDYVVPMVFPSDLKWRHDYLAASGSFGDDRSALGSPRFRSWGTEKLLIRCIRKNLPWIRTIHIILARPSQAEFLSGLNCDNGQNEAPSHETASAPNIRFVYHDEFMPKEVLPTFNSRAIEMYLHRIPGLADYFLYGNDDMFPIAPMPVEDFFRPATSQPSTINHHPSTINYQLSTPDSDLLPCLHYTHKEYNQYNAFHLACMNGLNFVAAGFGKHFTDYWLRMGHNVVPMLKATCEMFWQQYPKQMQDSVTRFRLPQNFNQYIYSWWQILSGRYVEHRQPRTYLSADAPVEEIREAIRTADGLLCINDNSSVGDITNLAAIVRSEIERRL